MVILSEKWALHSIEVSSPAKQLFAIYVQSADFQTSYLNSICSALVMLLRSWPRLQWVSTSRKPFPLTRTNVASKTELSQKRAAIQVFH